MSTKMLSWFTVGALSISTLLSFSAIAMDPDQGPKLKKVIAKKKKAAATAEQHFKFEQNGDVARFQPLHWNVLQPILERLIEDTLNDSTIRSREFLFDVFREDWRDYHQWEKAQRKKHCHYPISLSSGSRGAEGERVGGLYEIYHSFITLRNYTLDEKDVREDVKYNFKALKLYAKLVNENTFYNLMVRAGFKKEHFEQFKTGLQGRILVKPIKLLKTNVSECAREIQDHIASCLSKAAERYVTFVFNLPEGSKFTIDEIMRDKEDPLKKNLHIYQMLAVIHEHEERRIYYCLENDRRVRLDLHGTKDKRVAGLEKETAFNRVKSFVLEKYFSFDSTCAIITGKGNSRQDGKPGVLLTAFPSWMEDNQIKPLVESYTLQAGGGLYKINLKTSSICDFSFPEGGGDYLGYFATQIREVLKSKDRRLRVKTDDVGLILNLQHQLNFADPELCVAMSPFTMLQVPGEFRFIFNIQKSMMPYLFEELKDEKSTLNRRPRLGIRWPLISYGADEEDNAPEGNAPFVQEPQKPVQKPKRPRKPKQAPKQAPNQAERKPVKAKQPAKQALQKGLPKKANKKPAIKKPMAKK